MTRPSRAAVHTWLVEWVARTTEVPAAQIDADRPLQETGLSSREAVALAADLSELMGRTLAPTTLWQHPTVNGIVDALFASGAAASAPRVAVPQAGPVAVIGLGCRFPGGVTSPEQFWRFLDGGGDGISDVPEGRWESFAPAESLAGLPRRGGFLGDVSGFDAAFFGITPREAVAMDPQQRMLLEVSWAALEHAGIPPASLRGSRTGVFVGMSSTEYGFLTMTDVEGIDAWSGTGAAASIAANRLSYLLDLRGPSLTLDTACSSSLVAVHQAVQSLQRGEIDTAVVAGVNLLLSPGITANFARAGVLAADGHCKPFDADADGIVRGEGCGVVVLRSLKAARTAGDRVLAVIRGSAVNSDGRSNGMMAPNPEAQASLLADAYATAGVEPSSVDYVEAHGTGTLLGDPIEAGALGGVLGAGREADRPLLIGSVKSNLGHLEGAAGITGLIKVVLGLLHGRLPASLHYRTPNPHADLDGLGLRVVAEGTDWPRYSGAARAGVSAFGFGGTNAHVVLEEWPGAAFPPRVAPLAGPEIFALSAWSEDALRERAAQLADWLDSPAGVGIPLGAVAATLAHRRDHLPVRAAVVAAERDELVTALRAPEPRRVAGRADVVMVFSGYGSQWPEMGRRLLAGEPAFRAAVDELEPAFRAGAGFSLRAALLGEQELPDLGAVQLVLFGIQVALAGLWRAHGVVPAAVVGHSMGEVAAAVVAGALDVTDALRVMAARTRVLTAVDESGIGAMAVVELSADELDALGDEYPDVDVAVFASPTQCTVTGSAAQVAALVTRVEGLGRLARMLPVGGAGHSPAVDPALPAFRAELAGLEPRTPTVRCYTTVLPDPRQEPTFDVEHWAANMRRPVRFTQALAAAIEDGHTVFVEVSPHPVALAAIEQTADGRAVALASASRRVDERTAFLTTLAQLHVLGRPDALAARGKRVTPVELPGPVWRHESYWPVRREAIRGSHPLLGTHIEVPGGDRHLWRGGVGTDAHPWLVDHSALGSVLFPATGFLELALAAVRSVAGGPIRIADLELHQMLLLDARTEVTTSLTTAGRVPTAVEVHSRTADGDWTRCATASVRTGDAPLVPLGATTGEPVDVYELLAAMGQDYGPAFRGLGSVTAAGGRASATIALPEHVRDHPSYLLHPALGDACLHALAAATGDALGGAAGLYLPLTIGEVTLAGDPRRGVRVDAVVDSVDESGAGLLGHVQLVDAEGTVIVQFRDVYCRRVQRSALPVSQASLTYEAAWVPAELPPSTERAHSWIVLRDPAGSAPPEAVRDELIAAGDEVSIVDLDDPATVADLLRTGPVSGVLAFPAVGSGPDPVHAQGPVLALSAVVAVLAEIPAPPRLWVVTSGAAAVADGEAGRPDGAALRGLVRVLAFEHPELRASHLDLDPAGSLREEITADGPDDEVAWRGGVRHVRTLTRPELGEPVRETSVRDGAYVISGGLGGLGLVAATWLAERGATRIVLSGRKGAGPEDEAALDALRALGADVRVVAGDVAEPGTAERLVAVAVTGGMPLRGVLHAAGTLSDGAALTLDEDAVTAVWRPKALGAWRLHEATAGHELDWWLVYSSAAALFGSPGQAAYATANAWADALVAWRRAQGLPAATINWGAWGEVGAAAGSRNPVLDPLGTRDAMGALDAVLRRDRAATGIARVDTDAVLELFPALAQRPFFGLFVPASVTVSEDWAGMDTLRAAEPVVARGLLADRLVTIVAGLMGFAASDVDRYAPLTGLGLDSLMAVRARGAVERDFGLPLPVPLLLRGASLAEIADHLAEQAGFGTGDPVPSTPVVLGPRDPAERWVARHWQEQLPGSVRGVNDDLFAVAGADDEVAGRLRAAFVAELGAKAEGADLFAVPTIAAMADLLRDEIEGLGDAPMRLLRPGTERPLFLFHPAGGPTSVYHQLVGLLPDGPAVYGFERIDDEQTVEGKAARYVEMLREVQPHGPYRVGGWSFGGCLAYETARVLTEAGETVDLVVMIDTILPLAAPGRETSELLLERFERFAEHIESTYGVRFAIPRAELAGLDEEGQIRLVMERLAEQVPGMGHGVLHHQYTSYLDARVAERYVPEPYDGEVLLLRAKESHQVTTTLDPRYLRDDDALGWDRLCSRLSVVRVPGDHVSMIDPPHVSVLAAELAERLLPAMTR